MHLYAPKLTLSFMHSLAKRATRFQGSPILWLAENIYPKREQGWFIRAKRVKSIENNIPVFENEPSEYIPISNPSRGLVEIEYLYFRQLEHILYVPGSRQIVASIEELALIHELIHILHYLSGYRVKDIRLPEVDFEARIRALLRSNTGIEANVKRTNKIRRVMQVWDLPDRKTKLNFSENLEEFMTIDGFSHYTETTFRQALGLPPRTGYNSFRI